MEMIGAATRAVNASGWTLQTIAAAVAIVVGVIGAVLAFAGYRFLRQQKVGWRVSVNVENHQRMLTLYLVNKGIELQDMSVVFNFYDRHGKFQRVLMTPESGNPEPVKHGFT